MEDSESEGDDDASVRGWGGGASGSGASGGSGRSGLGGAGGGVGGGGSQYAQRLAKLAAGSSRGHHDAEWLVRRLHRQGVNCRFLLAVRASPALRGPHERAWRRALLAEATARSIRRLLRKALRKAMSNAPVPASESLRCAAADLLNLVFGDTDESARWWRGPLMAQLRESFLDYDFGALTEFWGAGGACEQQEEEQRARRENARAAAGAAAAATAAAAAVTAAASAAAAATAAATVGTCTARGGRWRPQRGSCGQC